MIQEKDSYEGNDEAKDSFAKSNEKLLTVIKKSNIRGMLPSIQMPPSKRSVLRDPGDTNSRTNQTLLNKFARQENVLRLLGNFAKDQQEQTVKNIKQLKYDFRKILPKQFTSESRKYDRISDILSHVYNQVKMGDGYETSYQVLQKHKVYSEWEMQEIQQNYSDTNLGDFVIKLINPDLLPKQFQEAKQKHGNKMSLVEALELYDHLFNTDQIMDKHLEMSEKQAFSLAFYIIYLQSQSNIQQLNLKERSEIQNGFFNTLDYFVKIQSLSYSQYIDLKKKPQFKIQEQSLEPRIKTAYNNFGSKIKTDELELSEFQKNFTQYKTSIYKQLRRRLIKKEFYQTQNKRYELRELTDDQYISIYNQNYQQFVKIILKESKSISLLLKYFPELTKRYMVQIKKQLTISEENHSLYLPLSSGGYLKRVSSDNKLKWLLTSNRPTDVLTLLRKFLIYRLSRRGGLFIRTFLSKQQNYIFLVIKASQQHLEKMAQQSNFNMEVELGSVDIFSFEPVDKYGRPLRCNNFIRDVGFIRKYNLAFDKDDRDQDLGDKSVQSQGLNLYKKALKMNKDELRAKIILDQQKCDSYFSWLSNKIGTRFIQPDQILQNQHNEHEVQDDIWPIYYVYNKMIIEYVSKLRSQYITQKQNKIIIDSLNSNVGLILRLMFLKALNFCNDMYYDHRKARFKFIRNFFIKKFPLQTIWNQMGESVPRGYFPYFYSERLQKIWRRYQINQEKDRSKFSPAARLIITNKIIREYLNISKSLNQQLIASFYPIHDPFILKHIKVKPYINVLSNMIQNQTSMTNLPQQKQTQINETFVQYECEYTKQDFTKDSMQDKLSFKFKRMTDFSVNSVAFYCGQKLAFFFQFRRYLTEQVWPLCIITFIVQIIFWVENTHLEQTGSSYLTNFNNALMVILVIINTFWIEYQVNGWKERQKKMARSFGTNDIDNQSQANKRVLFEGTMKRNLQTNQINDQHQNLIISAIKELITLLINVIFVVLMASTILIIFAFKGWLSQKGYSQSTVTSVPSILIALATQLFNFVYRKMLGLLVEFENKKTIHQYQNSLTSKSFIVTFVVTYFALFIYAFFEQYFDGETVCLIRTTSGVQVNNCYFYISSQIVASSITDLVFTVVMAFVPLAMFYWTQFQSKKKQNQNTSFNLNYFESIDCFYEEQDRMQTYMYTDEIDRTWQGYTAIVISFTTLALFAPIVPFLYSMMFVTGVVDLNAKKYEIIYFSKRTLPIKVNSIGIWLTVIRVISVVGVFVNVALVIYVRNIVTEDKAITFFSCVFVILVIKYIHSFSSRSEDDVGKRCKSKTEELISEKAYINFNIRNDMINTDIENLFYDERKLKRKLPQLKGANVKFR